MDTNLTMKSPNADHPRLEATTLIVGPGRYFGRAIIDEFARLTTHVLLVSRTPERLADLAKSPFGDDVEVSTLAADVRKPEEFEQLLTDALSNLPALRFAVYNVKDSPKGPALRVDVRDFGAALNSNITGALSMVRVSVEAAGPEGVACVLTGGGFKDQPDATRLALSVSKAGLHSLTVGLNAALLQRSSSIKTLVIDGVVRDQGPILPTDVAKAMVRLATDRRKFSARIFPPRPGTQLTLFDLQPV